MKILSFLLLSLVSVGSFGQSFSPADSIFFGSMKYRLVGPFRGGRSGTVAGDPVQKNTFYFGSTGGGVWKTTDAGSNWKNISDGSFGGSIGAVAVAPSDPTILYVGEGESTLRGNVSEGFGMWRSDDAGRNWRSIGLKDSRHIMRIIVHPKNPDIAWVAAGGHLFGKNAERGVFKTTDGGRNWKKVLYTNDEAGSSDIVMEPGNPLVLYAGTWRVLRTPYSLESGGAGSGLWKSTDGGETWKNISASRGLPAGTWGMVCISVSASNPDRVYAMIENEKGGLFVSNDAGNTWVLQNSSSNIRQRSWYFNRVFCDPKNPDIVYVLNVGFMKSTDGGRTFREVSTPHGDHHDLWIDPQDGNRMIVADDGGAQISFDGSNNWSTYMNQPTAQFYRVSTDNYFPYRILGAQQDNSTVRISSQGRGGQITEQDWSPTAGFESGYVVADPLNPDIVYGGNYSGYISRFDHRTGENRQVTVWPDNPLGDGTDKIRYRFQWNFPIFFSPHNPKRLYAAGNVLFASDNEGASWTPLSPDLTTNDKSRQQSSGGPITKDNSGVEVYCTIFTAAESVLEPGLLWTGSDDGLLHISRDGGKQWTNVTPPAAGKWMMWNSIETDPFQKGKAYIVGTKYKSDDFKPYIFLTTDYGQHWKLITNGIAANNFARVVRADTKHEGILYAGTEYGMFISYNGGQNWESFQLNLPKVPITDLTIKENDLVVATQGRSFWILDNIDMVAQRQSFNNTKNLFVFEPGETYRFPGGQVASPRNAGMNPPGGVAFKYYVANPADTAGVKISIYDPNHKLIRTFSTTAKENAEKISVNTGFNDFTWNMQYPGGTKIDGQILWNGMNSGPLASPGKYFYTVSTAKDSVQGNFIVKANPVYNVSQQDYDKQLSFLLTVRDKFNEIQQALKDISSLRQQINDFTSRQAQPLSKDIKTAADTILKQMTVIEETLNQTKAKSGQDVLNYPIRLNDRISGLYSFAASGYTAPAAQAYELFSVLSAEADIPLNNFKKIVNTDIPAFNALIREKALPVIGVKKN